MNRTDAGPRRPPEAWARASRRRGLACSSSTTSTIPTRRDPAKLQKEWAAAREGGITVVEVGRVLAASPDRAAVLLPRQDPHDRALPPPHGEGVAQAPGGRARRPRSEDALAMEIRILETKAEMAQAAGERAAEILRETLARSGRANVIAATGRLAVRVPRRPDRGARESTGRRSSSSTSTSTWACPRPIPRASAAT